MVPEQSSHDCKSVCHDYSTSIKTIPTVTQHQRWLKMIHHGTWWFRMVYHDSWHSITMSFTMAWFFVDHNGSSWSIVVHNYVWCCKLHSSCSCKSLRVDCWPHSATGRHSKLLALVESPRTGPSGWSKAAEVSGAYQLALLGGFGTLVWGRRGLYQASAWIFSKTPGRACGGPYSITSQGTH